MGRYLFVGVMLVSSPILFAQTPSKACCEMKIRADAETAGLLKVTIANVNQPPVTIYEGSADVDFAVRVTSESGEEVNRTEYGRRVLTMEHSGHMKDLRTGESITWELDLRALFELKSGTYNVAIGREVAVGTARITLDATATIKMP